jgi:hypothetical protein
MQLTESSTVFCIHKPQVHIKNNLSNGEKAHINEINFQSLIYKITKLSDTLIRYAYCVARKYA